MGNSTDFIIIGASIIDVLAQPVNPDVFSTGSHPADQIAMQTGGDALNEASVLAALGGSVRLVSKIGQDSAGEFLLDTCRKRGIKTDSISQDPAISTGINVVFVDADGERHFITSPNGSLRKLCPADIPDDALEEGSILCFASIFVAPAFDNAALANLFSYAKQKGMILCADMTRRKNGENIADMKDCLSLLDYIFPNYEEAALLTGLNDWDEIADAFLDCGVKHVILKAGKKGCFIKSKSERFWIPAHPSAKCIDTTGAGDTFTACFLYALRKGLSLPECGQFANSGASICIEQVGASGIIKNIDQILERCPGISID